MQVNRISEKKSDGFSLIEAVVGMAVVGVMIMALYSALTLAYSWRRAP